MTRFRQLLTPDPDSDPAAEQRRAAAGLPEAVRQSKLLWKGAGEPVRCPVKCLLLAVAPYSRYDLALLDFLDERSLYDHFTLPIIVTNLQDYETPERLGEDFPGAGQVHQSPVAALCEGGAVETAAWGKKARDLVAEALGVSADELMQWIMREAAGPANRAAS